jgi:hypothetical protein
MKVPNKLNCFGCLHWIGYCRGGYEGDCYLHGDDDGPYAERREIIEDENEGTEHEYIRCSVCGMPTATNPPFYALIQNPHPHYCLDCFNNPALWIPTKERCEQITREAKEESRRNPTQAPLWRFF